jgi:hypothetical protein
VKFLCEQAFRRNVSPPSSATKIKPPAACLLFALLIFDPEDGSDMFFRNVGSHTGYTALYPRRRQRSIFNKVYNFSENE